MKICWSSCVCPNKGSEPSYVWTERCFIGVVCHRLVVQDDRTCAISVPASFRLNIRPPQVDSDHGHQAAAHCGTPSRPWLLRAPSGQQISIRLLDFIQQRRRRSRWTYDDDEFAYGHSSAVDTASDQWLDNGCETEYGYIVDNNRNTSICGGGVALDRDRFVYQSTGSTVEIVLSGSQSHDSDRFTYLISFGGRLTRSVILVDVVSCRQRRFI